MLRSGRSALLLPLLAASLIASAASAAPTLPGINIRWDNCFADGGVMNKAFACNTNSGSDVAVLSVQLDTAMPLVTGMEIRFSLKSTGPTLPAWWEFKNTGSCRGNALGFVASPVLPVGSCVDWGGGAEAGGFPSTGYHLGEAGPGSAVGFCAAAVSAASPVHLDPTTEYIVGALILDHTSTVGLGSCAGCDIPVCLLFTSLNVATPSSPNDRLLTQGANGEDSQIIRWQNGHLINLVNHCSGTFACTTQFDCVLSPTGVRSSTWGAVKSLYR